jgi:hypothetical protein
MRKWPIWILLVLLPMRLWAGVFMPLPLPTQDSTAALTISATPPAEHAGHLHAAVHLQASHYEHIEHHEHAQHRQHTSHAHDTVHAHHDDMPTGAGSCHEGPTCMACSVCHMTAGMPAIAPNWSIAALQSMPAAPLGAWLGHAWPPLIKPPIS